MKRIAVIVGVIAGLGVLVGCLDQGNGSGAYKGPLFRYHFTGRASLGKDGTATVLKEIDALKETAALRTHFAQKLGAAMSGLWKADLPADATPQGELLRPLIEDLTSVESLVEIRGPAGQAETLIAVEISDERARIWETNLTQLVRAWKLGTPAPVTVEGAKGWAARRTQAPNLLQVVRAGKWTLLGLGQDRLNLLTSALQTVAKSGRPCPALAGGGLLDVQADLPGLNKWVPIFKRYPFPPVHLTMTGRAENVRTEMRLMYSQKIPWKFEPWQFPTNLISEPLTSFTVAQGIKPILERFEGLPELGVPLPNQYCSWGVLHDYGHTHFAYPQPGASNVLFQLAPKFPEFMKRYFEKPLGQFVYVAEKSELVWGGTLPGVSPTLAATGGTNGNFIFARLFPLFFKRIPPPADLYQQVLGRTNLLYYDWELSSNRVAMGRQLYQLRNIGDSRPPPPLDTVSQKWLAVIAPKLGNSATEVTQSGPQELLLTRKSQIGLTGFEMATLSVWLESPTFPTSIELPHMTKLKDIPRPRGTPAPAPAPKK
jgi:hypothetical protein